MTIEAKLRVKSWIKTASVVIGIMVSGLTATKLIIAGVVSGLDNRYVTTQDHQELRDQAKGFADTAKSQAASYADDIKSQVRERMDASDKRLDRIERNQDEMLLHVRAIRGSIDDQPLPRKP